MDSINKWNGNKNLSKRFDNNAYREPAEQPSLIPCSQDCGDLKAGITAQIGNSFEGNHQKYTPLDNTIAISNDGLIVSVDNGTVACFGVDSTDENAMIAFQRTGSTTYIELCVVNYDNGWSPQSTIIKEGVGILDQDSVNYERFGDYIDIQRRYNNQSCWVAGQFAFDSTGASTNHFGQTNGVNTWIAEIGGVGVGINEPESNYKCSIYPNPVNGNQLTIKSKQSSSISKIVLMDILGKTILFTQNTTSNMVTLNLPQGLSGIYFLTIQSKTKKYETYKVIINN